MHNLLIANILGVLWSTVLLGFYFNSSLYLQLVLGYTPLQVGLAFLPVNVIAAAAALGLAAKLVNRYGIKVPLAVALVIGAIGLALLARAPLSGAFIIDVLPAMVLVGLGGGIASTPLLLAAVEDVGPGESGVASGVVNTAFTMGGALGLALLTSAAAARTSHRFAAGATAMAALNSGCHMALYACAGLASAAAVLGTLCLCEPRGHELPTTRHR